MSQSAQEISDGFRLSPPQRRVWALLRAGVPLRVRLVLRFAGTLDEVALAAALATLLERHEILRTAFPCLPGMSLPVQVIAAPQRPSWRWRDLSGLAAEGRRQVLAEVLDGAPEEALPDPVRFDLLRVSPEEHWLVTAVSPLCCDRASLAVLAQEIAALYTGGAGALPDAAEVFQYADAAQWQNEAVEGEEGRQGVEHWRALLRSRTAVRLPFERDTVAGSATAAVAAELSAESLGEVTALAERSGTSDRAVLLAAWLALLGRLAGAGRLTAGVLLDGRNYQELEGAVGLFARSLPVTVELGEETPFRDLLRAVQEQLEEAALWQEFFSWDGELEAPTPPAAVPFAFALEDPPPALPAEVGGGVAVESLEARLEPFHLAWAGLGGLGFAVRYDSARFDGAAAQRIARSFQALLADALADAGKALADLEILDAAQCRQLLVEWNRTAAAAPAGDLCLHELFERRAAASPDAVALVAGERSVTYGALSRWSDAIAGELVRLGAGLEVRVGIFLERSPEAVAALLGILKAGAAYVAFNPGHPAGRLAILLDEARPWIVLTDRRSRPLLPADAGDPARPAVLELEAIDPAARPVAALPDVSPDNLAYLVFTSGSTGLPKGVAVPHRGVVSYLSFLLSEYGLGPGDVVVQLTDLSYDASVRDTLGPLLAGARLVLLPGADARNPAAILAHLRSHRATAVLSIVPTLLRALAATAGEEPVPTVRTLLVSGEVLRDDDCAAARRLFRSDTVVVNQYGPTECTLTSSYHWVPAGHRGEVPIGRPIANTRFHVLDRRMRPVPVGVPGELCIGGMGVTRGYAGLPDRTAASFVPDPFAAEPGQRLYRTGDRVARDGDGTLRFLERGDDQIKLRGIRVEPGEIAAHLRRHPRVQDAVVVARQEGGEGAAGDLRLVAYVVPFEPAAAIPAAERHQLPNGLVVRHLNRHETDFFFQQIFEDQVDVQCGLELKAGDIVFDVGANIGLFSLFVHLAQPGVRLFAFEPIPEVFAALRSNLELYGAGARLYNCGLSDRSGETTFAYYPLSTCQSGYYPDEAQERRMLEAIIARQSGTPAALELAGPYFSEILDRRMQRRSLTCPLRTVSEVLAEEGLDRIDLLKIDVEKSELDVLAGIREEDWPKVRQISIEAHDLEGRLDRIVSLLKERGYAITVRQEDALLEDTCLFNVYATRTPRPEAAAGRRFELRLTGRTAAGAVNAAELRESLRFTLPEALVPAAFVILDRLPVTASGKVDRKALPPPEPAAAEEEVETAREVSPFEELIGGIMAAVLGRDEVRPGEDFFALGGHSLLATQLILRLNQALQIHLPLQVLFEHPTAEALARVAQEALRLPERTAGRVEPIRPRPRQGALPLSSAQRRLWFLHQLAPADTGYNVRLAVCLEGPLQVAVFQQVFREIVRRHEALRTVFTDSGGEVEQRIMPPPPLLTSVVDLRGLSAEPRTAESERLIEHETRRPFDLVRGPLFRIVLLQTGPAEHLAVFAIHHIVSDHWSLGVLVREMTLLYNAFARHQPSPLPELSVQYADYAAWQQAWLDGEEVERHLAYWRKQLGGGLPTLDLPVRPERPAVPSSRGAQLDFDLPPELSRALRKLSLEEGTTLFMTLLAALNVLLKPYARRDEIAVGTDVANRTRTEVEPLIGFFVNVLVLRTSLAGNPTFRELLARVRQVTLDAYAHQDLPFDAVVEDLQPDRAAGRASLFQILFVLQNARRAKLEIPDLSVQRVELKRRTANFDLLLVMSEREEGLFGFWNYRSDLLAPETVAGLAERFRQLLGRLAAQPDAKLSQLVKTDEEGSEPQAVMKKDSKLDLFNKMKPAAINISQGELVRRGYLEGGGRLPLVLTPAARLELVDWARENRQALERDLLDHGAVLFRGFTVESVAVFERFAEVLAGELFDGYGDLPRGEVAGRVYTSTPYPPEERILYHNESSQLHHWPLKQFFYCVQPAMHGGETPIVDCRRVYAQLDPEIRERFAQRKVMYTRTFVEGLDVSLDDFFGTSDREAIEKACRDGGLAVCWRNGSELHTEKVGPGVAKHPKTGEMVFFNQIQAHHISFLKPEVRASLLEMFGEQSLPRNVYYGDGSPIEDEVMARVLEVYEHNAVSFRWQPGDILMVDNMLTAHSRNSFEGPRKIVVAMGEMISADQVVF